MFTRNLRDMKITWVYAFVLFYPHWVSAQERPRLFLFENQTNEASFNLFVGGSEPRPLSLVTNENISSLIVDSDSSSFTQFTVEVSNATGLESQAIQITTDIEFDSSLIIEEPIKTFVFNFADRSGPVSRQNLSIILATLTYVADLSSATVGETRIVNVFVYDDGDNDTHKGEPSMATLTLQQDNIASPVFNETNYRIPPIPENTAVNSIILTVNATDEAGPVRYELLNDSIPFSINSSSGEIYVNAPLNFENVSSYEFDVQAVDLDPFNPLTAVALVRITISDVNDEPPVFSCNPCNITAQEEVFTPLAQFIFASDIDTVGEPLTYNFSQADYQLVSQYFSINSSTGQISVIARLDYDPPTSHRYFSFTVLAFDGVQTGSTIVIITVLDGEDFVPSVFPINTDTCYNLDIGTTMVILNPDMSATDNSFRLNSGMARLTLDSVSSKVYVFSYMLAIHTTLTCIATARSLYYTKLWW